MTKVLREGVCPACRRIGNTGDTCPACNNIRFVELPTGRFYALFINVGDVSHTQHHIVSMTQAEYDSLYPYTKSRQLQLPDVPQPIKDHLWSDIYKRTHLDSVLEGLTEYNCITIYHM